MIDIEAADDHVHLLLRLQSRGDLPSAMHRLKGATARTIFLRYPDLRFDMGSNSFWQKGYGAREVAPEELTAVLNYIRTQDLRPLRH